MSNPKQPLYVPVVAGDLTDGVSVYAAPGKDWDGIISISVPPAGTYSAGLEPDQSWFGAQSMNGILQNYGRHIEAIADGPSFQVHVQVRDQGVDRLDYCNTAGDTHHNANAYDETALLYPAYDGYVLAQCGHKNGNVGSGFVRRFHPCAHKRINGDSDINALPSAFTDPPFEPGTSAGDTAAGDASDNPTVLGVSQLSNAMISLGSSRTVTRSTDYGVSWSAATALTTNANWAYPLAAVDWNGIWLVADYCPTVTSVNRFLVSTDLTAASWTVCTGSSLGGSDGSAIRRIIWNDDIAVFLPRQNTLAGYMLAGTTTVVANRIGSVDSTRFGWRGAWNEQIGLFLIGNNEGDLYTSSDGINWSQIASNESGLVVRDIVAHGRGFVISNSGAFWAIDYLDFDRKGQHRRRQLYKAFGGNSGPASAFHLCNAGGRWYGARVTKYVASGPANIYILEWVHSDVSAWDLNDYVGR